MTLSRFNNINERIAGLLFVFSDMCVEITKIRNYYANMRKEAAKSFEDSRQYWIQKENEENSRVAALTKERKAEVEEMFKRLDSLDSQLCAVDKSYAKRKETEYIIKELCREVYNQDTDYFEKLNELHNEAIRIATECALTVKSQVIQEIGMLFSNKRKMKYERLYYLITEAKRLRKMIFADLDQMVSSQNKNWAEKKNEEIDKAAMETAELIEAIDDKEKEEVERIISNMSIQFDSILSAHDAEMLKEMKYELDVSSNVLPEVCREYILIGELSIDVSNAMACHEAANYMSARYEGCFVGTKMSIPAIYDMRDNFNICFNGHGDNETVKSAIHSVIFTMLKNQPATRQTFVFSDPEGRAKGFDAYLDFAKQYPDVFGERILTTKEQIKNAVKELSRFVDEIGQTKLVGYRDLFEYNQDVPDKQESLRCLCLLNFPKYFDEDMLEDLYSIVRNGSPYGVHVLIGFDEREISNRRTENQISIISKIMDECICLENIFSNWKYSNGVSLSLCKLPTVNELQLFMEIYALQYKEIKNTNLPLTKIITRNNWFTASTIERLEIPIGKNEEGQIHSLVLGEGTSHHAMVIGSLGSGKSTLLHTIIMSSLINFSPDEINLYLMDFKSGTEFKVYGEKNIPHIKLLALDAMQEFGKSILDELWAEMNRRSALFNELIQQGLDIKDITDYRRMTGKKLPRILVIADEFQVLVSEEYNRRIANYCGAKLADFISMSRVYGIHFILATQTLSRLNSGFAIRKSTINEMYVRIGLKCIESECSLLFGEKNGRVAFMKMDTEKGTAVYTGDYVQCVPIGFKVAFCDPDLHKHLLNVVEEHYSLMELAKKTKVFVGNSVPKLFECEEFMQPYDANNKSLPVYLGEPIKIAEPTRINLNRTKRNNLLIAGNDQKMIDSLIGLYMINVLRIVNRSVKRKTNVYLFDGLKILGEMSGEIVRSVCSHYWDSIKMAEDNSDVINMIDEIYSEYLIRKENRQSFNVNADTTVMVIINNMQWIESITSMLANKSLNEFINSNVDRKCEKPGNDAAALLIKLDSFISDLQDTAKRDISNVSYGRKLMELIESGYTCGIHFVMSVPDFISIKEYMYSVIPKFGNKIIFSMSNDDASRIINDAKTEQMRSNIVIYHDGINPPYQIKPYAGVVEYIHKIKGGY